MIEKLNNRNEQSRGFVTALSDQGREFCIIGLTGKVRSGTSDVCNLLADPEFCSRMDKPSSTAESFLEDAREYRVIYRYLRKNWKPFIELSVTAVIISYVLDLGKHDLGNTQCTDIAKTVYNTLESCFSSTSEDFRNRVIRKVQAADAILQFSIDQATAEKVTRHHEIKIKCQDFLEKASNIDELFSMWEAVKKHMEGESVPEKHSEGTSFFFCFGILPVLEELIKDNLKKDDQYPMAFQDFGNSIRATGSVRSVCIEDCFPRIDAQHLFSLPCRINQFIKILRQYCFGKSPTKGNPVFVVINNFKNIFEAYYFKRRYSAFYLMAISCDEEIRQDKFSGRNKFVQMNLREDLSSGKKIYKSATNARCYRELTDGEEYESTLRRIYGEELGMNDAELDFIKEILYSNNPLRRISYEQNIAPFILQDVVTCIENADIFVTRDHTERDYPFDHQLIRQLGRIVTLILHPGLLTPTKIERCMQIAMTAKLNSGCLSRQVGAVVTDRNYNILSLGWNDAPCGAETCLRRNFFDLARKSDCSAYSNYELQNKEFRQYISIVDHVLNSKKSELQGLPMAFCFKDIYQDVIKQRDQIYTRALHGEERALASCGNDSAKDGYLFTTSSPCELCAKRAKEAGVNKIYYIQQYPGISKDHVIEIGHKGTRAMYEFFIGAVGLAYIKLYTPLIPYKDELAAFNFSPIDIFKKVMRSKDKGPKDSSTAPPPNTFLPNEKKNETEQPTQPSQIVQ